MKRMEASPCNKCDSQSGSGVRSSDSGRFDSGFLFLAGTQKISNLKYKFIYWIQLRN